MKVLLIFAALVAICVAQNPTGSQSAGVDKEWQDFKVEHNREFTAEEDARRKELFKSNLAWVKEHNEKYKKGEVGWEVGTNQFSDRTPEELKRMHGIRLPLNRN